MARSNPKEPFILKYNNYYALHSTFGSLNKIKSHSHEQQQIISRYQS